MPPLITDLPIPPTVTTTLSTTSPRLRVEFDPHGATRIWYGDADLSDIVQTVTITQRPHEPQRVRLDCLPHPGEPYVLEGYLVPAPTDTIRVTLQTAGGD